MSATPQRASVVVGMVMVPRFTQLDLTGPYEVFSSAPETEVHLLSSSLEPVRTERGIQIIPTTRYTDAPRLDVLCEDATDVVEPGICTPKTGSV